MRSALNTKKHTATNVAAAIHSAGSLDAVQAYSPRSATHNTLPTAYVQPPGQQWSEATAVRPRFTQAHAGVLKCRASRLSVPGRV